MTKRKKMKPVKMWAVIWPQSKDIALHPTRQEAKNSLYPNSGEYIVRVEVREISK